MRGLWEIPIVRKITSLKNLDPCHRRRIKRLKRIFREEGRIPLETSIQEMKYLLKLEAGRRRYRRRRSLLKELLRKKTPEMRESLRELEKALISMYPSVDEVLGSLARKRGDEREEVKGNEEGSHTNG